MEKQCGVGFLINKKLKNNVIKFTAASGRIAIVQVKLTSRYKMSHHSKNLYVDPKTTTHDKSQFKFIMGDFNANIGEANG